MTSVTSSQPTRIHRLRARTSSWVSAARAKPLALSAAALGTLMLAEAVILFRKGFGLTFYYDEWNWVMNRRGWSADTLLKPHNEHLSLVPVLIFKLLFVTVGITYWPYRLTLIFVHIVCVGLVFLLIRRRVGDVFALVGSALILFLGSAWEDLLWPFQIGYLTSIAAGLGMLLALDRKSTAGRAVACLLLAVSIASSSLGLPFAGIALVELLLTPKGGWRDSERWRHLWVCAAPLVLYLIWFEHYGNPSATPGTAHGFGLFRENGPVVPSYAADMAASAFAGLIGLTIDWGRPLVLLGLGFGIWWVGRRGLTVRTLSLVVGLTLLWGLTALLRAQLNAAGGSRYVYSGAVLIVLLSAELLRGATATARASAVAAAVVVFAGVANYGALKGGSLYLQDWSSYVRAELGALEVAGPSAPPKLAPDPTRAPDITADRYFAAVRQLGSPADTPDEVRRRPEAQREAADGVLVAGLRIGLRPMSSTIASTTGPPPPLEGSTALAAKRSGGCLALGSTAPGANAVLIVPSRGLVVDNVGTGNVEVRIRSFGDNFSAPLGTVGSHQSALLAIPPRPGVVWHAQALVPERVRVCTVP